MIFYSVLIFSGFRYCVRVYFSCRSFQNADLQAEVEKWKKLYYEKQRPEQAEAEKWKKLYYDALKSLEQYEKPGKK